MPAVCAHGDVADSRHQSGALDAFSSASPRTILGACRQLESFAFYASTGGDFNFDVCYWSVDVCCVYCGHCKFAAEGQCM